MISLREEGCTRLYLGVSTLRRLNANSNHIKLGFFAHYSPKYLKLGQTRSEPVYAVTFVLMYTLLYFDLFREPLQKTGQTLYLKRERFLEQYQGKLYFWGNVCIRGGKMIKISNQD